MGPAPVLGAGGAGGVGPRNEVLSIWRWRSHWFPVGEVVRSKVKHQKQSEPVMADGPFHLAPGSCLGQYRPVGTGEMGRAYKSRGPRCCFAESSQSPHVARQQPDLRGIVGIEGESLPACTRCPSFPPRIRVSTSSPAAMDSEFWGTNWQRTQAPQARMVVMRNRAAAHDRAQ